MTLKWPALQAALEQHTVQTPRGRLAGFLVRCMVSRKELGYVWQAGSAWRWRTPSGEHYGERSSQRAAVQVLRDAYDVKHGARQTRLLDMLEDEPAIVGPRPMDFTTITLPPMKPRRVDPNPPVTPLKTKPPKAAPAPPPKRIDWNTYQPTNVTDALSAAIRSKPQNEE